MRPPISLLGSGTMYRNLASPWDILQDVVRGIEKSDLIVADLTDSNPNVFYELGLAHALHKPVIMLSQEIEDLPFDLKSSRVIQVHDTL